MTPVRTLVVIVLVTLLAVDLAVANAVIAADRTVLNPGFVTSTLDEEAAYEAAEALVIESLPVDEVEVGGDGAPPLPVNVAVVVDAAVGPDYLRSQVEPNVERAYAYLHGRSDELELSVDVEPAKDAITAAVEAELTEATAAELMETVAVGGDSDLSLEAGGVSLDLLTVAEMAEDEAVFDTERAELREAVRERVIDGLVEETFLAASDDELLALVIGDYDPSDYTDEEKAQLVDDHEPDIRAALREGIEAEDDGEIAAAVDDQLVSVRETARDEAASTLDDALGELDPALAEPTTDLVLVAVDGYVADVSHETFSAELEIAADNLAVGATTLIEEELDAQVPDRVDLDEQLDPEAETNLENVRQIVQVIDRLTLALPLAGLGLVGAVYLVSRSVAVSAVGAGIGLTVGGLPTLVGASQVRRLLRDAIAGAGLPAGIEGLVLAMAGQVADAVLLQSAVVVGLGVVVLGAGLALHFGLVEWPRDAGEP